MNNIAFEEQILSVLPEPIKNLILKMCGGNFTKIQEIRLRINRPILIYYDNFFKNISYIVKREEINMCIRALCCSSVYAFADEIRNGFITISGGHRVGICGRTVIKENSIVNITDISGINIRIAKQVIGCGNRIMKALCDDKPKNILIVSPPECGKTTLIRDLTRIYGNRHKVSLIDERGEISAMFHGTPSYDIGIMTDVMDLCPKKQGIELMLRSMSPEIIVTDEIGKDDFYEVRRGILSGIKFILSAHGDDVLSTVKRLEITDIINQFDLVLLLGNKNETGEILEITDGKKLAGRVKENDCKNCGRCSGSSCIK